MSESRALSCPKCKAPLETHEVDDGVIARHCPSCFGVLYSASDLTVSPGFESKGPSPRVCPVCGAGLEIATAWAGQLEVDRCGGCGSIWFDAGEIQILRRLSGVEKIAGRPAEAPPAPAAPAAAAPAPASAADLPAAKKAPGPREMSGAPNPDAAGAPVARLDGLDYQHFQTSEPTTVSVLGEFPWVAQVGDRVRMRDFVSPPYLLSQEVTDAESVWTKGEYLEPEEVWAAFSLPGAPPAKFGVGPAQPNPWQATLAGMRGIAWTATLFVAAVAFASWATASGARVWEGAFDWSVSDAERSRVTPVFEVSGRPDNLELTIDTSLENDWAYFSLALIEEGAGRAYDFGREVSYYHGVDGGEAWSEGARWERFVVPGVPDGRYYLRLEPEYGGQRLGARVLVRRGVPVKRVPLLALLLLLLPPAWGALRREAFETVRWTDSDHPRATSEEDDE